MKTIATALIYTALTAVLLGIGYPLALTGIAQVLMHGKANGQMLLRGDDRVGSALIGQPFTGSGYFHSRPSAAGTGYDAQASAGSNYAPTSKALHDRVEASVKAESTGTPVPIDLVTASASGLDPDISPAAAVYQVHRVAQERHVAENTIADLVIKNVTPRQFGLLGEPRVNVLQLNLALDRLVAKGK